MLEPNPLMPISTENKKWQSTVNFFLLFATQSAIRTQPINVFRRRLYPKWKIFNLPQNMCHQLLHFVSGGVGKDGRVVEQNRRLRLPRQDMENQSIVCRNTWRVDTIYCSLLMSFTLWNIFYRYTSILLAAIVKNKIIFSLPSRSFSYFWRLRISHM